MAEYWGLRCRTYDSTETGGSSYVVHVGHAAAAIAAGQCDVALITLAGPPAAEARATGTGRRPALLRGPTQSSSNRRARPS